MFLFLLRRMLLSLFLRGGGVVVPTSSQRDASGGCDGDDKDAKEDEEDEPDEEEVEDEEEDEDEPDEE